MEGTKQFITRITEFDAGHRILNHKNKCGFIHGHRWRVDSTFVFNSDNMEDPGLGYAMDFAEIKRIALEFIDTYFDHGFVANPIDPIVEFLQKENSRLWLMSLNGENKSCNPSAENISKELFLAIDLLFQNRGLQLHQIRLYETPNSYVDCFEYSITLEELDNFNSTKGEMVKRYAYEKGVQYYDKTKEKNTNN